MTLARSQLHPNAAEPGEPILRNHVKNIKPGRIRSLKIIIDKILETIKRENERIDQKGGLIGLAAPQIRENYAIIAVPFHIELDKKTKQIIGVSDFKIFINPKITRYSAEEEERAEGCFSVDPHVIGIVKRATAVVIQALDREGNDVTIDTSDLSLPEDEDRKKSKLIARIFQHEIDHLHGMRFPDRVLKDKKGYLHWVDPDESDQLYVTEYRKYLEGKQNGKEVSFSWRAICFKKTWKAMKMGNPYQAPAFCKCALQSS